jgi:uncharacterized circularly permuted ATP-grasp superfamily protein
MLERVTSAHSSSYPAGAATPRPPGVLYSPEPDAFDEALQPDGTPRTPYQNLLDTLAKMDLAALRDELLEDSREHGVWFAGAAGPRPFRLDPVPRLITPAEWAELERGLSQRVEALDRFVADVYGEQRIVAEGRVPARVLESCDHFEKRLVGLPPPPARVVIAGLDVVRDAGGRFLVLEDNVRTPSGIGYALAAREALDRHLPEHLAGDRRALDPALSMLAATLRESAPEGVDEPSVVLLSDGRSNSAWYEHERLARALAIPLVTLSDLRASGGRLSARVLGRRVPVDVVYRRTDEDRLEDERGELTDVGAALLGPLQTGTLTCVNAFGTGVADDKLTHAYVDEMVRFYLDEEPILGSVATHDLGVSEVRDRVRGRIAELVIKPRTGHGGHGVVVAAHAEPGDVRRIAEAVDSDPESFVAQETIMLSRHPTATDGRLEPRHVDLRPFVLLSGEDVRVVPGGLTRVALSRDALVVNSSQQGGGKDTWVLS